MYNVRFDTNMSILHTSWAHSTPTVSFGMEKSSDVYNLVANKSEWMRRISTTYKRAH